MVGVVGVDGAWKEGDMAGIEREGPTGKDGKKRKGHTRREPNS